jgi:hypothetical protein
VVYTINPLHVPLPPSLLPASSASNKCKFSAPADPPAPPFRQKNAKRESVLKERLIG